MGSAKYRKLGFSLLALTLSVGGVAWFLERGATTPPLISESAPDSVTVEASAPRPAGVPAQNPVTPSAPAVGAAVKDEASPSQAALEPGEVDRRKKLFPGSVLVAQEESTPDSEGYVTHIELLQTRFKYPNVRIVDRRKRDPNGEIIVIDQVAMVADHVLVQKAESLNDMDFRTVVRQAGADILRQVNEKLYLVSFDGRDVHALDRVLARLKESGAALEPEPDFIRFIR